MGASSAGGTGSASPSSTTHITASAVSRAARARATPSCSTISPLSRMPAVSRTRIGKPSITRSASSRSRVVPGTAVTIARSSPTSAFNMLDFPTLGSPPMTKSRPSCKDVPSADLSRMFVSAWSMSAAAVSTSRSAKKSISSSGKSIAPSTYTRNFRTS